MNQPQQQGLNIDFKNTTAIKTSSGGQIWQQGVVLRKVSKFVTGTSEDAILPIPVFYDPETNEILKEGVPKELVDVLFDEE
jgi:hypothetical protein